MTSKKILIISILISLTSHVAMLCVTGFIDFRGKARKDDVLIVTLKEPAANKEKIAEEEKANKPFHQVEEELRSRRVKKEETVDLGSIDIKYIFYLKRIKKKIEDIWIYPQAAFEREEEGIAVVKFSIGEGGDITSSLIIESSGYNYLDQGALDVIRSAAPYDPLPREFNISQLNIVARFQYKLVE
ncbi:MAG: energy transducer TonB [Syntrophales bacterium]